MYMYTFVCTYTICCAFAHKQRRDAHVNDAYSAMTLHIVMTNTLQHGILLYTHDKAPAFDSSLEFFIITSLLFTYLHLAHS